MPERGLMSWMGHIFGMYEGVEFFGREEAKLDRCIPQAAVLVMRGVGDFGGVVVADLRR